MSAQGGQLARVRVARAGLIRLTEPPAPEVWQLVDAVGPVEAFRMVAGRSAPSEVLAVTGSRILNRSAAELVEQAETDLRGAARVGARLVVPEDPEWPEAAMVGFEVVSGRGVAHQAPPLALYVKGRPLDGFPERAITVVGSRACTSYGSRVTREICTEMARRGWTVVSGGAFGIDTSAHGAALQEGGRSVAVLACGIDRAYPVANTELLAGVAETGSVVSEYPPGTTPARHRFLVRNRLIAALGQATLVVEAGRRSGSLNTAGAANELGRIVMAVPGPVTSAMSVGAHAFIRDRKAELVTDAADVLALCSPLGEPGLFDAAQDEGFDPRHPTDGLDLVQARVYEALPARGSRTMAELAMVSGLPDRDVVAALPVLELVGLVRRIGPRYTRALTERAGA